MIKEDLIGVSRKKTEIYYCYKIKRKEINNRINGVIEARERWNLPITRSKKSYKRELKAHILLYKLHLFRKHTEHCDLEENIKKWKQIIYYMIGW